MSRNSLTFYLFSMFLYTSLLSSVLTWQFTSRHFNSDVEGILNENSARSLSFYLGIGSTVSQLYVLDVVYQNQGIEIQ
jgi:hypothetical protein